MTEMRKLALVMISNFGRADGGRETWAYQFLPRLLAREPDLSIDLYGLRVEGQPDTIPELLAATAPSDRPRLRAQFFHAQRNAIPNSLKMLWAMWNRRWKPSQSEADLALGVGSFVELACMVVAPGLRRRRKAVWLRTIYLDEKSHRVPKWLRGIATRIETAVLRRADLIIANGDDTAAHYRARGLSVEVIKNAVDLERWRMPPPSFDRPIQIAYIGRLAAVKGLAEFIELARRTAALPEAGAFRFHIVGDGDLADLAKAAEPLGNLSFRGAVSNDAMPSVLAEMDICVALGFVGVGPDGRSGGSGVSNAVLEQMAAGRLLLCWDNVAYRQIVSDAAGIRVRQGDVDALLDELMKIAADDREARKKSEAGREIAQGYGFDAHLDRFLRYSKLRTARAGGDA